jgi:hypothetical protein
MEKTPTSASPSRRGSIPIERTSTFDFFYEFYEENIFNDLYANGLPAVAKGGNVPPFA